MNRKLRALGLVLFASLAMSAAISPSASAVTDHFTTTKSSALLTGVSDNNIFKITSSVTFQCTTVKFTAIGPNESTEESTEVTVDPEYTGKVQTTPHDKACTASSGSVTEVRTNGCLYRLFGKTSNSLDGPVWIECPASKQLEIASSFGLVVSVPTQVTTTGGLNYENQPSHVGGSAIRIKATIAGITYTCAPTFSCTLAGIATHGDDSDYNGEVTVTGYEDIDGLPTPVTEGAQIPISVS